MNFNSNEKVAIFIDGSNLYSTARTLGFDIDYKKLLSYFTGDARLVRAHYYTALIEDQEFAPIRPLVDWLDYNGFTMVTKTAKEYTDLKGRRKYKANMDIELTIDMLELAPSINHAILFSGDGDFLSLIKAMQHKAVRCYVVSTVQTNPPMASDELRRQADEFIDLADISSKIYRVNESQEKVVGEKILST